MQGTSISNSQFGQTSTSIPGNQNMGSVGNGIPQLPAWAKDSMILPNPVTPEIPGKQP